MSEKKQLLVDFDMTKEYNTLRTTSSEYLELICFRLFKESLAVGRVGNRDGDRSPMNIHSRLFLGSEASGNCIEYEALVGRRGEKHRCSRARFISFANPTQSAGRMSIQPSMRGTARCSMFSRSILFFVNNHVRSRRSTLSSH
jgi:hypothetical protein